MGFWYGVDIGLGFVVLMLLAVLLFSDFGDPPGGW
jgi:hypothetical protein